MNTRNWPEEMKGRFKPLWVIGRGVQGEVWAIRDEKTNRKYALKKIPLSREYAVVEKKVLGQLKHPHVVIMECSFVAGDCNFIVLEFMKGGDLWARILKPSGMGESITKFYLYQVCLAIDYLHRNDVAHRDLKPQNILLSSTETYCVAKVADFGYSREYDQNMWSCVGARDYRAPEINNSPYTAQADIWSLGMVLHACLTGEPASYAGRPSRAFPNLRTVSSDCSSLLWNILQPEPRIRLTIGEVLTHRWFQDPAMKEKVERARGKPPS